MNQAKINTWLICLFGIGGGFLGTVLLMVLTDTKELAKEAKIIANEALSVNTKHVIDISKKEVDWGIWRNYVDDKVLYFDKTLAILKEGEKKEAFNLKKYKNKLKNDN